MATLFLPTSVSAEMDGALILKTPSLIAIYPKKGKNMTTLFLPLISIAIIVVCGCAFCGSRMCKRCFNRQERKKNDSQLMKQLNGGMLKRKYVVRVLYAVYKSLCFRSGASKISILSIIGQHELKLSNEFRTFEKL